MVGLQSKSYEFLTNNSQSITRARLTLRIKRVAKIVQYNNHEQHRLLRNRGPLYATQFLWYRFALFTTKTAPLRSAAVDGRYMPEMMKSKAAIISER